MKRFNVGLTLTAVVLILFAAPAYAQRAISLGVSGGLTVATGAKSDSLAGGYHVGGHLNFAPASLPIELLADFAFHGFSGNLEVSGSPDFRISDVALNAAYVIRGETTRPYLMGGVGMYYSKPDVAGAVSDAEVGFDVGGGMRFLLSGLSAFLQVRANFVGDNVFIPISFGMLF